MTLEPTFAWMLNQDRLYMLAAVLVKLETLLDIAHPNTPVAENTSRLITDLRAQCVAGADDLLPYSPMFPAFEDTKLPKWTEQMEGEAI